MTWIGPGLLAVVLLVGLGVAIAGGATAQTGARVVGPSAVSVALYGPYAIGVELASTLLLAALIGARHLGQRHREPDIELPHGLATAPADGNDPPLTAPPRADPAQLAADNEEPPPPPRAVRFWRKDEP